MRSDLFLRLSKGILWIFPALLLFTRVSADVVVVLTGLFFLYKSFFEKDFRWVREPWFLFSLLFWAYLLLVNVPLSKDPLESFQNAFCFIRWPLFAAALSDWFLNSETRQRAILISLLFFSVFVFFDTGWQFLTGVDFFGIERFSPNRLTGPFRGPLPGTLMLRVVFILLYFRFVFDRLKNPTCNVFYVFSVMVVSIVFVFLTGERMALLMILSGWGIVFIGLWLSYKKQRKKLLLVSVIILLLFSVIVQFSPSLSNRAIYSTVEKMETFVTSDYGTIFVATFNIWRMSPVFGHGMGTFRDVCEETGMLDGTGISPTHPHNLYLELAAETGVIGVLLFLFLLGSIMKAALKPLFLNNQWYLISVSFSVMFVSFWPLIGGIRVLSNWIASLVWFGVGWCLVMARSSGNKVSEN